MPEIESNAARRIKLRHLTAFVETVRLASLKAAAKHMGLTQPAITKTLNDLDAIVGTRLLTRSRGGVVLTPEGEAFLPFARQSQAALGHGLSHLARLSGGRVAPLRIGALPSVAAGILPDAVERFAAISPETPLSVQDGAIGALLDMLRSGGLDMVIGRMGSPEEMLGLSFDQLYAERVVFTACPGHSLADCADPAGLHDACILYPPPHAAIRPLVDRYLLARGARLDGQRIETVSEAFARAMTLGPMRPIWIISQGVVARDVRAGRLIELPISSRAMEGPVGVMTRSDDTTSPQGLLFRQLLAGCATPG